MPTSKPMTKAELISALAEKTAMTKKDVAQFLSELNAIACSETQHKKVFTLPGLCKLELVKRKAWKGHNPLTGEVVNVPAKSAVKCKMVKAAKDAITPRK